MLRKLLTVLAILTGLAAINAPAQARISAVGGTGIERVDGGVHDRAGLIAVVSAKVLSQSGTERRESRLPKPRPRVTTIVLIPTIQFGDRARE